MVESCSLGQPQGLSHEHPLQHNHSILTALLSLLQYYTSTRALRAVIILSFCCGWIDSSVRHAGKRGPRIHWTPGAKKLLTGRSIALHGTPLVLELTPYGVVVCRLRVLTYFSVEFEGPFP